MEREIVCVRERYRGEWGEIGGNGERDIGGNGKREIGGSGKREIGGNGERDIGGNGKRYRREWGER